MAGAGLRRAAIEVPKAEFGEIAARLVRIPREIAIEMQRGQLEFLMTSLDPFLPRTHIAYFSMELAVRPEMHTYAGGLGILAGDTARSCADLEIPVVFVTLLSRAGLRLTRVVPTESAVSVVEAMLA